MKPLFLASGSPRRFQLLQLLEHPFSVVNPDVIEQCGRDEPAHQYVLRLAREKAIAGFQLIDGPGVVVGADTIIVLDGDVLEKPRDKEHFMDMFSRLSGHAHQVLTAVAVTDGISTVTKLVTTEIHFCHVTEAQAEAYWLTGEPADKAGGYAIQGLAGRFVEYIKGSYFAVVGLPLFETEQLLQRIGFIPSQPDPTQSNKKDSPL